MNFNKAEFETSFGVSAQLPNSNVPEIVFAGRSNVGKSSLLNKLFNRKNLARVSSVPGKTITINFYNVDNVKFVDLPGYGYAKISKKERDRFGELMETFFNSGRDIRLAVQLIDMRHKPTEDDYNMMEFLKAMDIPFIIVMTKADKLKVKEFKSRMELSKEELQVASDVPVIAYSPQTGLGLEDVKKYIVNYLND